MDKYEEKRLKLLKQAEGIITPYSDQWVTSHRDFAGKMWPNKIRRRDEAYNRWKFKGPQKGDVDGLLLAVVDGQVIGQLGLIPDWLWVDGKVYRAQWACDLMVDTVMRRKGIGSMLHAVAMSNNIITLASNPSKLADVTSSRMGFKSLYGPTSFVLPIDVKNVISWKIDPNNIMFPILSSIIQPLWSIRLRSLKKKPDNSVHKGNTEEVAERIQLREKRITVPHIVHDISYLNWRYSISDPTPIQTLLTDTDGYAICEATPSCLYVYDWYASNNDEASSLLLQILDLALKSKSKTIAIYANDNRERDILKSHGYLKMRTPVKIIIHPVKVVPESCMNIHYCLYDSDGNL